MDSAQNVLIWSKLSEYGTEPYKSSEESAGFDLRSAYNVIVPAKGSALIKTDIQVLVPEGTYGRIAARSGLTLKHSLDVGAGVIDRDYRGNVGVILFNHSNVDYSVKRGDRIAQLICERIVYAKLQFVEKMTTTERNTRGLSDKMTAVKASVTRNDIEGFSFEKRNPIFRKKIEPKSIDLVGDRPKNYTGLFGEKKGKPDQKSDLFQVINEQPKSNNGLFGEKIGKRDQKSDLFEVIDEKPKKDAGIFGEKIEKHNQNCGLFNEVLPIFR